MCPPTNGSDGLEQEKFPDADPDANFNSNANFNASPSIAITVPEEVPDAGLRSLDHCRLLLILEAPNAVAPMLTALR